MALLEVEESAIVSVRFQRITKGTFTMSPLAIPLIDAARGAVIINHIVLDKTATVRVRHPRDTDRVRRAVCAAVLNFRSRRRVHRPTMRLQGYDP